MMYGPVLIPDLHILRIDEKTGEEYYITYDADTITRTAQLYMKQNQHHNVTIQHEFAVNGCYVVESWVKQGADKSTTLGFDLPDGTWFVGMYAENDEVWANVKAGNVKGFSIEGFYQMLSRQIDPDDEILRQIEELIK